jgi:thiamine biosynthesis lipoprotein
VIHVEHVMGCAVSFDVRPGPVGEANAARALKRACRTLHRADATFSTWIADSPMSRLRRGELELEDAPRELAAVLDRCAQAKELSGGWFDPWAMPGGVDPTGLVKGWAAQLAARRLEDAGVEAAMVNAAGDVVTFGHPEPGLPWRIGVRDPRAPDRLVCVVDAPAAVATSAAYERGDHVLDPHTGAPAHAVLSATVTGPDMALADALATGLFAAGADGLETVGAIDGYGAMVVDRDGQLLSTESFPRAD